MKRIIGVGIVTAGLALGLFVPSYASPAASLVEPIRWDLLDKGLPTDQASESNRGVVLNATRYTLTTWYPARFGAQTGRYLDLGGDAEENIRPPASATMSLAMTLGTKAYDADRTGVPTDEARAIAIRLLTSIAYHHKANQASGGTPLFSTSRPPCCRTTRTSRAGSRRRSS